MHKTVARVFVHKSKPTVIVCLRYDSSNLRSNKGWKLIPAEQSALTNRSAVSIGERPELQTFSLRARAFAASSVLCAQSDKRNFALRRL